MLTLTDRSRILSYQTCPRQRFLQYHALGTGIVPTKKSIPLTTGTAIHRGIQILLLTGDIEKAVEIALSEYTEYISKYELEDTEDQLFTVNEQKCLIEGLIRVYGIVQYPKLISEYEVLEVEKEIGWNLVDSIHEEEHCIIAGIQIKQEDCIYCIKDKIAINNITIMSKPDAILRDKSTNGLVVYSLKTSSSWNDTNEKQNKYDDQGISELIAVENYYKYKQSLKACQLGNDSIEVEAIKMDFLIKGQRTLMANGDGTKIKIQNSFIVHPYLLDSGFMNQWSIKYTKAKGWKRVNIWEHMSMKEWIDFLFSDLYDAITGQGDEKGVIVSPVPYNRSTEDVKAWLNQNRYKESLVSQQLNELKELEPNLPGYRETDNEKYKLKLDQYFWQDRHSCFQYGGFCPYSLVCWEGERVASLSYESRTPHHETELI
jgi:hypothetical protein